MPRPIHLDTSFLILSLAAASAEAALVEDWTSSGREVRISAITWAEFLCGPVSESAVDAAARLTGIPIAFRAADATLAGRLFNVAGRRRSSLADCMIAATAIKAGASVATNNLADFERFASLGLEIESV